MTAPEANGPRGIPEDRCEASTTNALTGYARRRVSYRILAAVRVDADSYWRERDLGYDHEQATEVLVRRARVLAAMAGEAA